MRPPNLRLVLTLGAAFALSSACFSYTTLPPSGPKLGERVRVRVTISEAERLDSMVGVRDRAVEGDWLEQADTSIALAVPLPVSGSSLSSTVSQQAQQRIVIPRAAVQEMQLRRLDKLRTSLLIGGTLAAVTAIAVAKGSSLLGGSGATGSPNENRVPRGTFVLRWSLPIPRQTIH